MKWPSELIERLTDSNDFVRQAARRSLVILSFLVLNPEEANLIASRAPGRPATPLDLLHRPVDFGPGSGASKKARITAADRWTDWWKEHPVPEGRATTLRAVLPDAAQQLAAFLVKANAARQPALLKEYRDARGSQYTYALAGAIPQLSGEPLRNTRRSLAERMTRLTETSLGHYLQDDDAEVRRAAALGLAMRDSSAQVGGIIDLLLDPDPGVARAAHTALCSLSGQDFGPRVAPTEEERTQAVERWREWWQKQKKDG